MTTPTITPFDITEALPGVEIQVSEWRPLPDGRATVISGETGAVIIISNYYEPTDPRPMLCRWHGVQRHDFDEKREAFVCKVCEEQS